MKLPLVVALPLTLVVAILLGLVIERGVLRPLIGEPIISVIMVTFGFASVIRGVLNMTWGSDTRPFPALFASEPFRLGPVPISPVHLWSFVMVDARCWPAFSLFFKFSLLGMAMRATADNQQVAQSLGVSVKGIFALSWCIATVVSALGGIILGSVRGGVDFSLADFGLKVFPVVILGGLDSVAGAIIGGVLIGVLENLSGGYLDPVFGGGVKEVAPFVVLVRDPHDPALRPLRQGRRWSASDAVRRLPRQLRGRRAHLRDPPARSSGVVVAAGGAGARRRSSPGRTGSTCSTASASPSSAPSG